jgi:hypothetical protein
MMISNLIQKKQSKIPYGPLSDFKSLYARKNILPSQIVKNQKSTSKKLLKNISINENHHVTLKNISNFYNQIYFIT